MAAVQADLFRTQTDHKSVTDVMNAALEHSERELSRAQSGENSRMPLADCNPFAHIEDTPSRLGTPRNVLPVNRTLLPPNTSPTAKSPRPSPLAEIAPRDAEIARLTESNAQLLAENIAYGKRPAN